MKSDSQHWNRIFLETADEKMGWYESDPAATLRLLEQVPDWQNATAFLPGAGTSVLIDTLLDAGAQLVLNDISSEALDRVKARLGERAAGIRWLCGDIVRPLDGIPPVELWIDRALLHFLLKEEDIRGYFDNVMQTLKVGGHALFAEFAPHGAPKCAGLELHRYSVDELGERLGPAFELIDQFDHTYINPAGDPRPYIYALFGRTE